MCRVAGCGEPFGEEFLAAGLNTRRSKHHSPPADCADRGQNDEQGSLIHAPMLARSADDSKGRASLSGEAKGKFGQGTANLTGKIRKSAQEVMPSRQ